MSSIELQNYEIERKLIISVVVGEYTIVKDLSTRLYRGRVGSLVITKEGVEVGANKKNNFL